MGVVHERGDRIHMEEREEEEDGGGCERPMGEESKGGPLGDLDGVSRPEEETHTGCGKDCGGSGEDEARVRYVFRRSRRRRRSSSLSPSILSAR